jgi:hypothetical protein
MIDIAQKKEKIISFLQTNGPSLPVRIARAIEMEPVFASAILSELLQTKKVTMSHMRIGSSSLYLLPGQEEKLEKNIEHLKPIEQEALSKLQKNKTLIDEELEPAIRVALRGLRDFAISSKPEDKIIWKYAFSSEKEPEKIQEEIIKTEPKEEHKKIQIEIEPEKIPKAWEEKKEEIKKLKQEKKVEPIFEEKSFHEKQKTFLNEVEAYLKKQNISMTSIQEVDKKSVIAKIKLQDKNAILFAFNKQRINEQELMKVYKQTDGLPYYIIIRGDLTKKMTQTLDAYKKLIEVAQLE